MADFESIVATSFKWEGGYSAYSNDSASWCGGNLIGTNRGISAVAYKGFYGVCPSVDQLKSLTVNQAKAIYKKLFWDKLQLDTIKNDSVAQIMFQYIIGSGQSQISDLKKIANQTAAGIEFNVNKMPIPPTKSNWSAYIQESKKINDSNQAKYKMPGKSLFVVNDTPFTAAEAEKINELNQEKYWQNLKQWRLDFFYRLAGSESSGLHVYYKGWVNRTGSYVYSGATSIDKKKMLIIAGSAVVIAFIVLSFFKNLTLLQKIILALSLGVLIFVGSELYKTFKNKL